MFHIQRNSFKTFFLFREVFYRCPCPSKEFALRNVTCEKDSAHEDVTRQRRASVLPLILFILLLLYFFNLFLQSYVFVRVRGARDGPWLVSWIISLFSSPTRQFSGPHYYVMKLICLIILLPVAICQRSLYSHCLRAFARCLSSFKFITVLLNCLNYIFCLLLYMMLRNA